MFSHIGGGRAVLSQRFTRHFHVLNLPPASDTTLSHIFSSLLTGYLTTMPPGAGISSKFEQDIIKLKQPIVSATIELYTKISEELLPTPSKFHYTFNLRDISKVFQGTDVFSLLLSALILFLYILLRNFDDQS